MVKYKSFFYISIFNLIIFLYLVVIFSTLLITVIFNYTDQFLTAAYCYIKTLSLVRILNSENFNKMGTINFKVDI